MPSGSSTPRLARTAAFPASPVTVATYVRSTSRLGCEQPVDRLAVVREQEHAFGEIVEPSGVRESGDVGHELEDGAPSRRDRCAWS